MKKRIISLVLVVVMLLSFLCSCSFNYANRKLTKYASFNATEFEKALLSLVIDDGDFGIDEVTRHTKVLDTIFAALATDAGTDNKIYDATVGKYDVLYYGYYVTFSKEIEKEVDGEKVKETVEYTVFTDAMNPAKPGSLQFGLLDSDEKEETLGEKIEALVGDKNIKDYVFSATTEGKTEAGDKICISYTMTYSVPKLDADGKQEIDAEGKPLYESKTVTVNYGIVTLDTPVVTPDEDTPDADTPDEDTPATTEETGDNTTTDGGNDTTTDGGTTDGGTTDKPIEKLPLLTYLIGQKVGKVGTDGKYENVKWTDDEGVEHDVTYTGLTINWIIEDEGTEIGTVTDKTYTTSKKVKDVNGVEVDLKDAELTYHIFPMYIVDVVDQLDTEVVLKKILGTDTDKDGTVEDSEKGSLALFNSEEFKNGEDTLKTLIEKLVTAYNDLAKAEKALVTAEDKAKKEAEKEAEKNESSTAKPAAEESTEDGTTEDGTTEDGTTEDGTTNDGTTEDGTTEDGTTNDGTTEEKPVEKTEVEKAQDDVKEKQQKVDELVGKIAAATNGKKTVGEIIVGEYQSAVYDNLEASYVSSIRTNLSKEIFKLAEKYVTFTGKLPKSAVKQAYERIENVHKYNFYQGNYTNSDKTTVPNYVKYEGNYENFLKVALGLKTTDTMENCKAKMTEQAEKAVKELIIVYTIADHYGDDVKLTKEQKKSVKNNIYVVYLGVEEDDLLHAMQWDNVVNHILEQDDADECEHEYADGVCTKCGEAEYDYTVDPDKDNSIKFVRLEYTFTPEKAEDENTDSGNTNGGNNTTDGGTTDGGNDTTDGGDDTTDGGDDTTEDEN